MFIKKISSQSLRFAMMAIAAMFFSVGAMWAQNVNVTGTVTDKNNEPLVGVYVLVQGAKTGTSTDVDGKYILNAPANGSLIFSSMGFQNLTVAVSNRSVINVTMQDDAIMLSDVVVTAMGIKKEKKALGYAVQDLKSEEILKNKSSNVINSLAGKVAGVNVTQSGGSAGAGSTIIIRGGTSLEKDNQPLFVVDGIIFDNSTPIGGNSGFDGAVRTATTNSNRLMDINPEDIENMSVLKGPAAAALYGSRAAAGVIIITTKRGTEGRVVVNFSSKFTSSWVNRFPEQQDGYTRGYYNQQGKLDDYSTESWGAPFAAGQTMYNNMEDFFQNGTAWDNSLSVSGGSKNGSFYLSASRFDQTGIVPTTGFDKTTFRFNGEQKYGRLTVGANVSYSISNTDKTLTSAGLYGSGGTGAMNSVYRWSRSDDMNHYLNEDGSKYRMFADKQVLADDIENPYWILNKNKMSDQTNRFTGSVNASYKVAEWLDINYRLGYDSYTTTNRTLIAPGGAVKETFQNGKLSDSDQIYDYITSNVMLNFHKKFGDFDLNLLLGQSVEDTKSRTERRNGYNFVTEGVFSFENIANTDKFFQSLHARKRLMGVYGEFRASYKNIAYITVTGRNDWASTLPVENRSYFYPSVSGSFVFTELLPKNNVLSFGKIRASWAKVGKDTNPNELETTLWSPRQFLAGVGIGNSWQRGNPFLKPERTYSYEIGLELKFFNGRLGLDYTYYDNKSVDQIVVPRLSQTTGYILLSTNVGTVRNKGMELSISGSPISNRNFNWDMTLNLAGNRGTVEDLLTGQDVLYVTDVQVGNAKSASFNKLYNEDGSVKQKGIFMGISGSTYFRDPNNNIIVDPTTGLPKLNSKGTTYVGNREPSFTGGFNNSLQYKNWNLSFLFDFRIGGDIYNGTDYFMTTNGMSKRSMDRKSITVEGVIETQTGVDKDGNKIFKYDPKTTTYEAGKLYNLNGKQESGESLIRTYYNNLDANDFTTKTNWLRLRALSLSYNFSDLIKRQNIVKGLTVTASGTNLWLLTNYKGLDPEASAAGSGVVGSSSAGMDYCGVPSTAGFSFGINLTF
ncbi:MAG: SusC/RagA family TonB-linked outer membrane protein [Bacteroidales bacterium]